MRLSAKERQLIIAHRLQEAKAEAFYEGVKEGILRVENVLQSNSILTVDILYILEKALEYDYPNYKRLSE